MMSTFSLTFPKNKSPPNPQPFLCHVSRIVHAQQRRNTHLKTLNQRNLLCAILSRGRENYKQIDKIKSIATSEVKKASEVWFFLSVCVIVCYCVLGAVAR